MGRPGEVFLPPTTLSVRVNDLDMFETDDGAVFAHEPGLDPGFFVNLDEHVTGEHDLVVIVAAVVQARVEPLALHQAVSDEKRHDANEDGEGIEGQDLLDTGHGYSLKVRFLQTLETTKVPRYGLPFTAISCGGNSYRGTFVAPPLQRITITENSTFVKRKVLFYS